MTEKMTGKMIVTKQKHAMIKYSSINIGDDMQSIAAKRFLPSVDSYVQRERTDEFKAESTHKLIMNAWWMWDVSHFPPSKDIDPLLISMYLRKEIRDDLVKGKVRDYLIEHGPVGCRDTSTCDYLNSISIPAYFSGCLTLTLVPNPEIKTERFILVVDMDDDVVTKLQQETDMPVFSMSRMISPYFSSLNRLEIAELALYLYQSAYCVVSPCLHVVLPCLALGTNVLRIDTGDATGGPSHSTGNAKGRFSGMEHLVHTVSRTDFMKGNHDYDVCNPPSNPSNHIKIAEKLIENCKEFTGFDNQKSLIKGSFPLVRMFQILEHDPKISSKALYASRVKEIIAHLLNKVIFKKTHFDSEV